jgi:predicted HD phosphohydrolase
LQRVNRILNDPRYREYLKLNEKYEAERKFCRHDLGHFLDVARIAYILVLENRLDVGKEVVYAAALLHDIGRWLQYSEGKPHDEGSAELAEDILTDAGFDSSEKETVMSAVKAHRGDTEGSVSFSSLFSRSDKLSRNCFECSAEKECNWNAEKKNMCIKY